MLVASTRSRRPGPRRRRSAACRCRAKLPCDANPGDRDRADATSAPCDVVGLPEHDLAHGPGRLARSDDKTVSGARCDQMDDVCDRLTLVRAWRMERRRTAPTPLSHTGRAIVDDRGELHQVPRERIGLSRGQGRRRLNHDKSADQHRRPQRPLRSRPGGAPLASLRGSLQLVLEVDPACAGVGEPFDAVADHRGLALCDLADG